MELDDKVCYCFHVSQRKILNYIRQHKPRRATQISECGGAGTGCGWCVPYLKRYFDQARSTGAIPAERELTAAEYARLREQYIRAGKQRPEESGESEFEATSGE